MVIIDYLNLHEDVSLMVGKISRISRVIVAKVLPEHKSPPKITVRILKKKILSMGTVKTEMTCLRLLQAE